jgi:hemerythrin-like domain-containing protein
MPGIGEPMADTRDMYMVHTMFRREFGLLPGLVRGVADGDHARVKIVTNHLAMVNVILTHHHHAEDAHIWPRLVERSYSESAGIVGIMESQHANVDKLEARIAEAVEKWQATASVLDRVVLAELLDELFEAVNEHMGVEEELALPLIGRHITAAEWQQMVESATDGMQPAQLTLAFGMVMYEGDPAVIEEVLRSMPEEVRPMMRPMAAQAFTEHSLKVHGTPVPPRSTELN